MAGKAYVLCAAADRELARRLGIAMGAFPDVALYEPPDLDAVEFEKQLPLWAKLLGPYALFVVLWSPRAREAKALRKAIKVLAGDERRVILCLVGGESRELLQEAMPPPLQHFQSLDLGRREDLFDPEALAELARQIRSYRRPGGLDDSDDFVRHTDTLSSQPLWEALKWIVPGLAFTSLVCISFVQDSTGSAWEAVGGWASALWGLVTPSGLMKIGATLCYVALVMAVARHLFELTAAWAIVRSINHPEGQAPVPAFPLKFALASTAVVGGLCYALLFGIVFGGAPPGGELLTGPERGPWRVVGRVSDIGGRPLGGVTVAVLDGPGARTDDAGRFTLDGAPTGDRRLAVKTPSGDVLKSRPVEIGGWPTTDLSIIYAAGAFELGLFSINYPRDGKVIGVFVDSLPSEPFTVSGLLTGRGGMFDDFKISVWMRPATGGKFWVRYSEGVRFRHENFWETFIRFDSAGLPPDGDWEIVAVAARVDSGISGVPEVLSLDELPPHIRSNTVRVRISPLRREPPTVRDSR